MKKAVLIGAVLMLALPAMAQEAIELTWTVTEDAGMYKIIGTLTSNGDAITGIDASNVGGFGLTGFTAGTAQLYQNWPVEGSFDTPAGDYKRAGTWRTSPAIDTHFLFLDGAMTVPAGGELAEDNDWSIDGASGWGKYLTGTFGINPAYQSTSLDFVQIYANAGTLNYYFEAAAGNSKSTFQGTLVVPEPTTIALLGLGAVGLLKRRRNA